MDGWDGQQRAMVHLLGIQMDKPAAAGVAAVAAAAAAVVVVAGTGAAGAAAADAAEDDDDDAASDAASDDWRSLHLAAVGCDYWVFGGSSHPREEACLPT